jgi:hypothetical protein
MRQVSGSHGMSEQAEACRRKEMLLYNDEKRESRNLMSVDFDDMASKAKAAHEARIAEQDRQDAAQRDDKGRIVEAAIAALTADVLPLLEKAAGTH